MFTFKELQDEVLRSATRDQAGTEFSEAAKNCINRSIYRIAREAKWRSLRRKSSFDTVTSYTTGTGAVSVTNDSKNVTVTGATFLTDNIEVGRRISLGGSNKKYTIATITGETTLTVDQVYDGTTATDQDYEILPQDIYNSPVQSNHQLFLWHEQWGTPTVLQYETTQHFYEWSPQTTQTNIPYRYHMWEENNVISQIKQPGILTISSSSSADTSQPITIFGTVSGYPDYEIINTNASNGTTAVNGTKSFSAIERVVADGSTRAGRITVTADSANTTIAVLPVGATTREIMYSKIQLYPLPNAAFKMNVWYYKTPYMLVNDGDVHELGEQFDQSIIFLATSMLRFETSQEEGKEWLALYKDELKTLKRNNVDKIDWAATLKSPFDIAGGDDIVRPYLRYSQAGSYFGPRVGRA